MQINNTLINQKPTMLADLAKVSQDAICAGSTKDMRGKPALYALWWINKPHILLDKLRKCQVETLSLINPSCTIQQIETSIPLYLGTTSNLSQRLSQHMKLGVPSRLTDKLTNRKVIQPGQTNHQLRLGLEEIFPEVQDSKQLILDHVGVTYLFMEELSNNVLSNCKIEDHLERLQPLIYH